MPSFVFLMLRFAPDITLLEAKLLFLRVFMCLCLFLVASFTFYLAKMAPELSSAKDSDDNVISFSFLDNSESPFSGSGYEDPSDALIVSNVTSDGFDLVWESNKHIGYDSYTVELKDISGEWSKEVHLQREVTGTKIRGLMASTEYQVRLYGISNNQRSSLLEAVAITAPNSTSPDVVALTVKSVSTVLATLQKEVQPADTTSNLLPEDFKTKASGDGLEGPLQGPPGDLNVTDVSRNTLKLSWSAPEGVFDSFIVQLKSISNKSKTSVIEVSGEAREVHVDGLTSDMRYEITLYGMMEGEKSQPVNVAVKTEEEMPYIGSLSVSDISWDSFNVSWTIEEGFDFDSFIIEVANSAGGPERQNLSVSGDALSLWMSGLSPNTSYIIALYGVHESSVLGPVYTEAVTEAEPEIEHLFVSDVTPESFRLAWTAEDDVFDRFVLKVRDSRKLSHPREYSVPGDERTKILTQLLGGTEYEIELYGVSMEHRSQPVTAVARTGLGTLRDLRFSDVKDTSAVVSWTEPRAQPDSYRITYIPIQGGTPMIQTVDGTQSRVPLMNLTPGETYQVSVIAVKGLEESEPVTDTFTTALDAPRSLTAVNVTDTKALLLWQPAVATVDGYVITYSADTVPSISEQVSGNTVDLELSSLAPATPYTVSVYAIINKQRSSPTTTHFTTDVDAPRDLVASNIQTDSVVLSWKPPRAAITGYILTYQTPDGGVREVSLEPSATSHSLSDLRTSTEHTVRLQAVTDGQRSKEISTIFTTVETLYRNPMDCSQTLLGGESSSGPYTIYITGDEKQPVRTYCDMTTDEGGWMVFLRRHNGKLDFYRNWRNYSAGFGDINDEFWLGLSNLHKITANGQYELRVDLRDGEETVYAHYDKFYVGDPRSRYKIQIGGYSGTAGDSLTYHQNRPFSTYDNDNDIAVTNCALSYKGAFWYKNCHRVNLMGRYGDNSHSRGINWFHWKGHEHSIPFAEMKIRPVNFRNLEGRRKRS